MNAIEHQDLADATVLELPSHMAAQPEAGRLGACDVDGATLPRCCRAWIGEQAHAWTHTTLKQEREHGSTRSASALANRR